MKMTAFEIAMYFFATYPVAKSPQERLHLSMPWSRGRLLGVLDGNLSGAVSYSGVARSDLALPKRAANRRRTCRCIFHDRAGAYGTVTFVVSQAATRGRSRHVGLAGIRGPLR